MPSKAKPSADSLAAGAVYLAPAVFLSAFLIFQVQPMIGKHILPWFGGAPAVWTTCLLFFQSLLLAGYAYAHLSASRLPVRWQVSVHLVLLLAAVTVSILPGKAWQPQGDEYPLFRIIAMLLASVGLPFFALSASGPLLQSWYTRLQTRRTPYPLYAVSNAGSLLALISYPLLVERQLAVPAQARVWSWTFAAFIVLCATVAWFLWKARSGKAERSGRAGNPGKGGGENPGRKARKPKKSRSGVKESAGKAAPAATAPRRLDQWLWIAWSACAVILFMAVTNLLTVDIAPMPLLWVLPLSIYLVSFIVTFSSVPVYRRRIFAVLLVGALAVFVFALPMGVTVRDILLKTGVTQKIALASVALFILCMVCNGELYRLRPDPSHLTRYYLSISVGGALGGFVVAVIAPNVFLLRQELQLGLILCCVLYLTTVYNDPKTILRQARYRWVWASSIVGVILVAGWTWIFAAGMLKDSVRTERDFFGLVRVKEVGIRDPDEPHRLEFYSGTTLHGMQLVDPQFRTAPTAYFGVSTGVGLLMNTYQVEGGRRIGIAGMGIATLSAYGQPDDEFTYYELNPTVVDVAYKQFSYLEASPSEHEILVGDARLNLERGGAEVFDILVLDAFNSDSVPVHLLTAEAMEVYESRLSPNGVLVFNVTNDFVDLFPLIYNLAELRGFEAMGIVNTPLVEALSFESYWVLLSRNRDVLRAVADRAEPLRSEGIVRFVAPKPHERARVGVWTDNFSNIFDVLRINRR
ncbi:MAG: ferrichrome ABC transporter permease [Candidatus Eisenbacteria bacterium]|nr:ferrichrome ABC transporter permease [Candidatus Eisenbacteria bacterium]